MTACAKLTASASAPRRPSRTSRRQVNNWPADNPYLRAVADTRRGALALSATIRRFSSGVQRRRAPVSITSSRDTFDIVVCSVIRLCLRGFIPQRKAAVAGGLRCARTMVESMACSLSAGGPRLAKVSNAASHTPSLLQRVKRTKTEFAVSLGHVAPRSAGAQNPENTVGRSPLFRDRWTTFAPVWEQRVENAPFRVRQIAPTQCCLLQKGSLESKLDSSVKNRQHALVA